MGQTFTTRLKSPDVCSICLGKYKTKSSLGTCGHNFCFDCIQKWSQNNAVCPLCKKKFKQIIYNVEPKSFIESDSSDDDNFDGSTSAFQDTIWNYNEFERSMFFNSTSCNVNEPVESTCTTSSSSSLVEIERESTLPPVQEKCDNSTRSSTLTLNPPEIRRSSIYIALHNFNGSDQEEMKFNKDDRLEIINKNDGAWWFARNKATNETGLIPSNYITKVQSEGPIEVQPWYFGTESRANAEALLMMPINSIGSYLIRKSESSNSSYSLSVRDQNNVRHYRINQSSDNLYSIASNLNFGTLLQLIEYYKCGKNILNMSTPCVKIEDMDEGYLLKYNYNFSNISRSEFQFKYLLGNGQFGQVWQALWKGTTPFAVKTLKQRSCKPARIKTDLLRWAKDTMKIDHPRIVKLYNVCTTSEPFYVITEFMEKGSLLKYLQLQEAILESNKQIYFSIQIASGMAYLESHKIVHMDLAAKNVLLGKNLEAKICDHGLLKYYFNDIFNDNEANVRWLAPEAARNGLFSSKSDVWSFGIVMMEIATNGNDPYEDIDRDDILDKIDAGYRMPCIPDCPSDSYKIMLKCWEAELEKRPDFKDVHRSLLAIDREETRSTLSLQNFQPIDCLV